MTEIGRIVGLIGLCSLSLIALPKSTIIPWLGLFGFGFAAFMHLSNGISVRGFVASLLCILPLCAYALGSLISMIGLATALLIAFAPPIPKAARPFLWLGTVSYSLYLLHVPIGGRVINLGLRLEPTVVNQVATLLAAGVVTLVASWAFYRLIEGPSLRASTLIRYGGRRR